MKSNNKNLQVTVCVATRKRRIMLERLLQSLKALKVPSATDVSFLIVENDVLPSSRAIVDKMKPQFQHGDLHYELETQLGIPFARNKAVDCALKMRADVICFVDDDETVAADWLEEMISAHRQTGAELIGGPVFARFDKPNPNALGRILQTGLANRFARVAAKAERLTQLKRTAEITVITSNWLGTSRLFRELDLSFDTALQFTGGSDVKFCRDCLARHVKIGWAPKAHVFETIPEERLSLRYQFHRGLEQSIASGTARITRSGRAKAVPALVVRALAGAAGCIVAVAAVPFTRGETLVDAARCAGKSFGPLLSAFGAESKLYVKTTGH